MSYETQLPLQQIESILKQVEAIAETGDYRLDQSIALARDRLLMMWAEARRAADAALDAANLPEESPIEARFAWEHQLPPISKLQSWKP